MRASVDWAAQRCCPSHWLKSIDSINSFRRHRAKIAVWGVGGITRPEDAIKHFLAGASVVQIGTLFLWEGPTVFEKLWAGIEQWLAENGFSSVEEIIGAVREI
jgi:dihydroorotate dehydrogenase